MAKEKKEPDGVEPETDEDKLSEIEAELGENAEEARLFSGEIGKLQKNILSDAKYLESDVDSERSEHRKGWESLTPSILSSLESLSPMA